MTTMRDLTAAAKVLDDMLARRLALRPLRDAIAQVGTWETTREARPWGGLLRRTLVQHVRWDARGRPVYRSNLVPPPVPFGWAAVRMPFVNAWLVGPWWLMAFVSAWGRRWFWMNWLYELDAEALAADALRRYADELPAGPVTGRLLELPHPGCNYREIRPRGWSRLCGWLADFRREMPRWD